jgi:hypothetical protein
MTLGMKMFGFYVLIVFILGSASGSVAAAPSDKTVRPSASVCFSVVAPFPLYQTAS